MRLLLLLMLTCLFAGSLWAQEAASLTQASAPVSVGLRVMGNVYHAQLDVLQAATVTLWCPIVPGLISLSGLQEKTDIAYDRQAQTLQMALPPGKYTIDIRSF